MTKALQVEYKYKFHKQIYKIIALFVLGYLIEQIKYLWFLFKMKIFQQYFICSYFILVIKK